MSLGIAPTPLVLRPHCEPFNFVDKWSHPLWKRQGVYLWSIEHQGVYLASYVGQTSGSSSNFDRRIWQEFNWWKSGRDYPVDIEEYKAGRRRELAVRPDGHLERELAELKPILRLWLMPLESKAECDQAERWLVAELCKDAVARQFLANRNPERYQPDPRWPVQIQAGPTFRIIGLTIPNAAHPYVASKGTGNQP